MAQAEAAPAARDATRACGGAYTQAVRLHRAPRVARRERVLPVAVRGGRDPHARRRRRVGDRQLRRRPRQPDRRSTHELRFPHSLGLLYSAFTYFTGFKVNSGEYKLMGLAPYGEPQLRRPDPASTLIDLKDDGSFRMDMSYFNYCQGLTMTSPKFDALFGGPPRAAGVAGHRARDGHRRVDPGGDRRDHAAHARGTCTRRPA